MSIINIFRFRAIALIAFMAAAVSCAERTHEPEPFGTLPSQAQIEWQKMEYYMFIHFGPNTFTGVEWGDGREDPSVFNPTDLDCRQWAETAKNAGMTGIIITAKHHDGFCLWPSAYSTHTVRESPWKDGKGDVLRELSDACREYGLKFGVYLSPWDQNHPAYGTDEYNAIFASTLEEVLTNYGEVFEQWFDGANGEGPNGKLQAYDWELFNGTVLKHQPDAIIFSDIGPGCRWMGNEEARAGETNWSRLDIAGFEPGRNSPPLDTLNSGNMLGAEWVPGEANVSIRPGWFYTPETDDKVKTLDRLMDIYYTSVGRNATFLLNVPPDRRGRIHPADSARLMELRREIESIFSHNLAEGTSAEASPVRGNSGRYAAKNIVDGSYDTYWATGDGELTGTFTVTLKRPAAFNRLMLQEYIPLGQRVSEFDAEYFDLHDGQWKPLTGGTTIGYKRILRFPEITTDRVRVNITGSLACPLINGFGLYSAPEMLSAPAISRSKEGVVSIRCGSDDPVIYYTVDGTEPTLASERYSGPFAMPGPATVRAFSAVDGGKRASGVVTVRFDIAKTDWSVVSPQAEHIGRAVDDDPGSAVNVPSGEPLVIDLGSATAIKGITYDPLNEGWASNIYRYDLHTSTDGRNWTRITANGSFANIKNNPIRQETLFRSHDARYVRITCRESTLPERDYYTVGEIGVVTR